MKAVASLVVLALGAHVHAEPAPLDAIVRARLATWLPAGLAIAKIHLPPALASLEVEPTAVTLALPRQLRTGRPSIKLGLPGRRAQYIPVTIGALVEVAIANRAFAAGEPLSAADFTTELRAIDGLEPAPVGTIAGAVAARAIAAGAPIATGDLALPPPLARGAQVAIEIRRGAVRIHGAGTLELAARPGEPATARLAHTKLVVHGTLIAPATVVVGGP